MTDTYSIAIVGAGPKGTYALDSLATALEQRPPELRIVLHIFEPHRYPGAGPVYDHHQPHYLRLNYANHQVNMWPGSTDPSLVNWLECRHPHLAEPLDSAPRAVVGEYLHDGFNTIVARLRRRATVHIHRHGIDRLRRNDHLWTVETGGGTVVSVESVLLATGHHSRTPAPTGLEGPNYLPFVYPIDESNLDQLPAGSVVATRGLGLTAIDAILALTEGRGGKFDFVAGMIARYRPSGHEPATIMPYSRTGLLMTPKPWQTPTTPGDHTSERVAQACADALRGSPEPVAALAAFLDAAALAIVPTDHYPTDHVSRRGLADAASVAYGASPPALADALGATWRDAYPAIVEAVGQRQFDDTWDEFAALARRMERVAFGPPAPNAARLAALIEAGIVDLSVACNPCVTRAPRGFALASGGVERHADAVVNAVITPPGIAERPSPLFAGLLDDGHVRRSRHSAGIDVDTDTRAIGAHGNPTPGLAVIGRMTDGVTLGNDTLSRTLHDFPERWAATCLADISTTSRHRHASI